MPELPEVQALALTLSRRLAGLRVASIDIAAVSALKTADPPYTSIVGEQFLGAVRFGKFLGLHFSGDCWLVIHLARAGWLRLTDKVPVTAVRPGRGPLMARLVFVNDDGEPLHALDLTEAGTRKGAAMYVVRDPADVPGVAALGPDALDLDAAALTTRLRGAGGARIKNAMRDQRVLCGIGNAYSDEILHFAQLSPYAPANALEQNEYDDLAAAIVAVLEAALARAVEADPTSMKAEKKLGLRIHGRTGAPCPVCGTAIAEVALADRSFQYCPTCQTDGKLLADRRMSRLLK